MAAKATKVGMVMMVREKINCIHALSTRLLCAGVVLASLILAVVCFAQEPSRKVVARTAPSYPELARKMHLSGKVKVEVVISAAGSVTSAKLVGGNPVFEASAIEAVKQWKFETSANTTKTVIALEFAAQ